MAVSSPQADRPRNLSGGADTWDVSPVGVLLLADYFDAPAGGAVAGDLAATESGADTAAMAGTVGSAGITGDLSAAEAGADTAALAGAVQVAGTLASVTVLPGGAGISLATLSTWP